MIRTGFLNNAHLDTLKKALVAAALAESDGNVSEAARLLGIDRTNLHKKIQAYDLGGRREDQ